MPSLFPAVAAALMVAAPAGAQNQPAAELPAPAAATATSTADQIDLARQWNAERAFRESWHRAGDDLRARISSGEADPEQEASRAAALARWSLITSYTSIPSGSVYAIGMECRPNRLLFVHGRLFFLAPHLSHTIVDRETLQQDLERERRNYERFRRFALVYNRALIRHLEFPFRDLCRPAADDARPPDFEQFAPDMPGFRDLKETDRPVDLYEAARLDREPQAYDRRPASPPAHPGRD